MLQLQLCGILLKLSLLEGFREHDVTATPVTLWAIGQSTEHLKFRSACHGAPHGICHFKANLGVCLFET